MSMVKDQAEQLKREIQNLEQDLSRKKRELEGIYRRCRHNTDELAWGPAKSDPIVTQGYQDPGDPEGTMGIDRRLPQWIPGTTTPRWTRECKLCGYVEETRQAEDKIEKIPVFSSRRY